MLHNLALLKPLRAWLQRIAGFSPDAKRYLVACGLLGIGSGFVPPILAAVGLYVLASGSFAWFFGRRGVGTLQASGPRP